MTLNRAHAAGADLFDDPVMRDTLDGEGLHGDFVSLTDHELNSYYRAMNRISGLEKKQAPWHLRWFYTTMRKMFGKDLTPVKQQMRVPGLVWGSIAMEAGMGRKRKVSLRFIQLGKVRTAARVGCPF